MAPVDRLIKATAKIVVTGDLKVAPGVLVPHAKVGSTIEISNADDVGVWTWHWSILPPDGSWAFLASPTSAKTTFKVDRPGSYAIRLQVNAGPRESVNVVSVVVEDRELVHITTFTNALHQRLCDLRDKIAIHNGVPPNVVASDRTLREIALLHPRTRERLCLASGFSSAKADKYGDEILGVVAAHHDDRPSTAVAQLRELASWLRAEGESSKADDADELAEAIAFKYEVV